MPWTPPPLWSIPREWDGERAFVICGGESVKAQRMLLPQLRGRVVAVKQAAEFRPDADVLFWSGERAEELAPPVLACYQGPCIIVRGKGHTVFPPSAKRVGRVSDGLAQERQDAAHATWSTDRALVSGYDSGTSAINVAIHFGATTIVLLGYDMIGGRAFDGPHYLPRPREQDFQTHMRPLPALAEDAKRKGIRIVNCSPISRVECFERGRLEDFL
jgi:hypothetical protein